jgi:hypothetical protein
LNAEAQQNVTKGAWSKLRLDILQDNRLLRFDHAFFYINAFEGQPGSEGSGVRRIFSYDLAIFVILIKQRKRAVIDVEKLFSRLTCPAEDFFKIERGLLNVSRVRERRAASIAEAASKANNETTFNFSVTSGLPEVLLSTDSLPITLPRIINGMHTHSSGPSMPSNGGVCPS